MSLLEAAQQVAAAQPRIEKEQYGPWLGNNIALPLELVPKEYANGGRDMLYVPAHGFWKRRLGSSIKFDTLPTTVGLLPAKWSGKCRDMHEFLSDSISDSVPTLLALVTKEKIAAGLDDGRYGTIYVRNQVDNLNYTLGSDYDTATTYPNTVGAAEQSYKIIPLWYDSGDGGLTRGTSELARRFLVPGSRRIRRIGRWWYSPSFLGTPSRWNGRFRASASLSADAMRSRVIPSGPIPPTHPGIVTAGEANADGSFKGSDRFAYAVAYRFEDGSVWAPSTVRLPNNDLPDGLGIATVDTTAPDQRYRSVNFTHLPVPPEGVLSKIICRGPKVDSTGPNALNIDPYDLRPIAEVAWDTTTYEYFGGDDATLLDRAQAEVFIRHDYIMPPRARYVFDGDLRVGHGYGGTNPCAIELAIFTQDVLGDANDHDGRTELATGGVSDPGVYGTFYKSYVRIAYTYAASLLDAATLLLTNFDGTGAAAGSLSIDLEVYDTFQKLVDRINRTSLATDQMEWRATILPGVDPQTSSVGGLTPHSRTFQDCSFNLGFPTLTGSFRGRVAVGSKIICPADAAMNGKTVIRIDSADQVTLDSNATSNQTNVDVEFYFELGDNPSGATATAGRQRVVANSLPGFLYYSNTALSKLTLDRQAVWLTTAQPGQIKSAPNCFSGRAANRHNPPALSGNFMGGGSVDNGFCLFWANKRGAIRNTRDTGTGLDEDHLLFITNEISGAIGWNTICQGNRFVCAWTQDGVIAMDLFSERLISEAIYLRSRSLIDTAQPLHYQAQTDIVAAGSDTDLSGAMMRIASQALWLAYSTTGNEHPQRLLKYDFSAGIDQNGLVALERAPGLPWGWSTELIPRNAQCLVEARRSDGMHLYMWDGSNAGSTGDGRIDEIEVGDTDNGSAISQARVDMAFLRAGDNERLCGLQIRGEFAGVDTATFGLDFIRSRAGAATTYAMTPAGGGSDVYLPFVKFLPAGARAPTDSAQVRWRQSAGAAGQLRSLEVRFTRAPKYK